MLNRPAASSSSAPKYSTMFGWLSFAMSWTSVRSFAKLESPRGTCTSLIATSLPLTRHMPW